jgi:hypothetical protein
MKIHTKNFITPQAKFNFNHFCFLPTISFSVIKTGKDFDKESDSEISQVSKLLKFEWLFFSAGFVWLTVHQEKPFKAEQVKYLKHKANIGWRLLIAFLLIILGLVLDSFSNNPKAHQFESFFTILALLLMFTTSLDRSDYLLDEYSDLVMGENEVAIQSMKLMLEMRQELYNLTVKHKAAEQTITDLETELNSLKSKPAPRKKAVKETVSEA